MAARTYNIIDRRSGRVVATAHGRAAAREAAKALGGQRAGIVTGEYRDVRRPAGLAAGKTLAQTRGHAPNPAISYTTPKPAQFRQPRTNPDINGVRSGGDRQGLADLAAIRAALDKTQGTTVKVSIRGRHMGNDGESPEYAEPDAAMQRSDPRRWSAPRVKYRRNQEWLGRKVYRRVVGNMLKEAEQLHRDGVLTERQAVAYFARLALGWPVKTITEMAFEDMR